jgi:iron complex outermembrane receptor protein
MKIRLLLLSLLTSSFALADDVKQLAPTVVTATRIETNSFDLPVSIAVTNKEDISEGQLKVNISESSVRVPGVVVNNRNNPAQDLAIQIRGFGARSAFGVRGVRLYADGIPMTMPDGQGQTGTFNLDTASRIEYLKGPFSAMYGNSSGGVVQIFTEDGPKDPTLTGSFSYGSYDSFRESATYGGTLGNVNYNFNASTYKTDGYRDHSDMRRDSLHGKIKIDINDSTKLTLVTTFLDQPDNKDPQGISLSDLQNNRRMANSNSLKFNTRVTKKQQQIGAILEHKFNDDNLLSFTSYTGQRDNIQFGSASVVSQLNDKNSGGVSTIDRSFGGADLNWTNKGLFLENKYQFVAGINYGRMNDLRKGYNNFITSGTIEISNETKLTADDCGNTFSNNAVITCGIKGDLRRNENNIATNFDQYFQGSYDLNKSIILSGGVRRSTVRFKNEDHYIAPGVYTEKAFDNPLGYYVNGPAVGSNPDDSGSVKFKKTTPVLGFIFKANDTLNLYANMGKSFETPTFTEMSYSTSDGLNLSLKPATSNQFEFGIKTLVGASTLINASIYKIDTKNEISLYQQTAGRSIFQNIDSSQRKGLELSVDTRLNNNLKAFLAYSYLDAEFTSAFTSCTPFTITNGTICNGTPQTQAGGAASIARTETISAGAKIPGTYKHTLYGELLWNYQPLGFSAAVEARAFSDTNVAFKDDYGHANGYAIASLRTGFKQNFSNWRISEFLRVDNIFDKEYVGSIRVADLNENYFEPAPTRNYLLGINASYQFK